jgi:hypothetical protein
MTSGPVPPRLRSTVWGKSIPIRTPTSRMDTRSMPSDAFELLRDGESGENLGGALFGIGPDRQANTVTIEALDLHNQGIFTRRPNRK